MQQAESTTPQTPTFTISLEESIFLSLAPLKSYIDNLRADGHVPENVSGCLAHLLSKAEESIVEDFNLAHDATNEAIAVTRTLI